MPDLGEYGVRSDLRFAARYPRMWQDKRSKCLRRQVRHRRLTLVCCRYDGHEQDGLRHLFDTPPVHQILPR